MLKQIIYISFFSFFLSNPSISEIRELYKEAPNSQKITLQLVKELETIKKTDNAVLVGYKAASLTLLAKNSKGVKTKKGYFKEGKELLEFIISKNPKNIELRFIRLTIQEKTPKFLKYKEHINEDKSFIYNQLKNVKDSNLQTYIKGFVLQSKSFSIEEKNVISEL
ncbi:MAG: hypothetical protein L3J20_01560 [Flavobacteriaceae bacterium]|nr:hypothetical protein [Flavobacteriaceae bacterium]